MSEGLGEGEAAQEGGERQMGSLEVRALTGWGVSEHLRYQVFGWPQLIEPGNSSDATNLFHLHCHFPLDADE